MAQVIDYLYVCATGVTALRQSRHGLQVTGAFAPEFDDNLNGLSVHNAFGVWLRQNRKHTYVVIADLVEEEFVVEQMPKVGRIDQAEMVKRRLKQKFRDARLNQWSIVDRNGGRGAGLKLKREKNAQTQILMSAIGRDQILGPWLNTIEENKGVVRSVVSPALLTLRLLRHQLKLPSGLIVSWAPGGLRQTLVIDGEVRFSRLAATLKSVDAKALQIECLRTVQYLLMSQQISRDTLRGGDLPVWVMEGGIPDLDQLPTALAVDSTVAMPLGLVPMTAMASELSYSLGALPSWCAIESLSPVPGSHQRGYADSALRHDYSVRTARQWLFGTGAGAAGLGALSVAASLVLHMLWPAEDDSFRAGMQRVSTEQGALQSDLGRYAVAGPAMRKVVESAKRLEDRHVDPLALMQISASALEVDEHLLLRTMRWKRLDTAQSADWQTLDLMGKNEGGSDKGKSQLLSGLGSGPLGGSQPPSQPPLGSPGFGQVPVGAPPGAPLGAAPGVGPNEQSSGPVVIELLGAITGEPAMARANEQIKDFATRLKQECGCDVHIAKLPFDTEATTGFNKSFAKAEKSDKNAPEFAVRWLLKKETNPSTMVQTPGVKSSPGSSG